ncbi:VWA domain-containing protein [Actinoplanes auranticolor]|uniref:VWA domain-containing protein n=1 Tax=Actinoplanes auranticolor TaxID=47988 RepID=UPI001FE29A0C|nr:VWA domain-containing protein [Actinoplanes auranticolor]
MPGRHRRTFSLTGIVVSAATASLVVIGAGSWLGYQRLSAGDCAGEVKLAVAAAAEIAGAIQTTADKWMQGEKAQVGGVCIKVAVAATDPATAAATIAAKHGVALPGLKPAAGRPVVPDVWVPDSSSWLLRVGGEAPGFVPTDNIPVAESPVVLAMPAPMAQKLGWPERKLKWQELLGQLTTGKTLLPGIVDPTRDAAGLTGLLALGAAAGNDISGAQRRVAALRKLAANTSSIRQDLLEKFPRTAAEVTTGLSAAPLSEEDVVSFNAGKPPIQLAALYLDPAPTALNYPFAVMPEVDPQKASAAAALHEELRGTTFRDALAAAGLRGPDGKAGAGFVAPTGAPPVATPVIAPGAGSSQGAAASAQASTAISQVLGSWAAITQPGRVLAVFDISGSMLTEVPTAGGLTRAEVTKRAAAQGLQLFDDRWAVGTWFFSTELVGKQAWQPKVPISPLSTARNKLNDALNDLKPKKTGDTGLYDTALAAYKNVQKGWQQGRVNSVILFTDGVNENPDGLTRDKLVADLKRARDPNKPVRMVIIGIGPEVDRAELKAISDASGPSSGVFIAEDPAKINEIFLQAIATRTGA